MDDATLAQTPTKKRRLLLGCLVPILIVFVMVAVFLASTKRNRAKWQNQAGGRKAQPAWVPEGMRFVPWAAPGITYDGPGRLVVYMERGCREGAGVADPVNGIVATGKGVTCRVGFVSTMVPGPREMVVHLPANFETTPGALPVVYAFHGFGQRPGHSVAAFAGAVDEAQAAGRLPPLITVFLDSSLGGNGLDDLATPWDENGGNWGVNSNRGRFADHFKQEIVPHVVETYRASDEGAKTILLGASMGGTMAVNYMIDDPQRFPNIGAFYPAVDLRFSCGGDDRLGDYSPDCYEPITRDNPNRPMTTHEGMRGRLFSERMFLFPVFNSDSRPGPVWQDNKPVWERVKADNPVDRLRDEKPDLKGTHMWYLVGDKDDFNIDAQVKLFDQLARAAGVSLAPDNHLRPGRHDMGFFHKHVREAIAWMNVRLAD